MEPAPVSADTSSKATAESIANAEADADAEDETLQGLEVIIRLILL